MTSQNSLPSRHTHARTNEKSENQHGKKDKKDVLFYSGLQKTVVNPILPCKIAQLLQKAEKDKPTISSLGHF